ncbi:MAG: prephenate dehydrogenase/arogenate dehydrogenase family protein [Nanoarchaeota archaeon]|nr:prephenate dehydrogenase/arogenate dehydrogenase family protein [Nanoarchaeota archaeon]
MKQKKPKTISIIGGRGKMGSLFAKAFRKQGYKVLISGRNTALTNIEAAKQGDVVIICVPIRATINIIKEIGPFVRPDALISDFTSVKVYPCKAMEHYSKAEVIGSHPLFGPSAGLKNQNMILCPIRGNNYLDWYKKTLKKMDLKVDILTPEEHDKQMALVQALNHLSNLIFGQTLKRLNIKDISSKHTTPAYLLRLFTLGRLFAQDKELYSDIMAHNPYTKTVMSALTKSTFDLNKIIQKSDKDSFEDFFQNTKMIFEPIIESSSNITGEFIKLLNKKKVY